MCNTGVGLTPIVDGTLHHFSAGGLCDGLVLLIDDETRTYWEARDPIKLYVDYLLEKGGFRQDALEKIDLECTVIVDEAVRYADSLPFPKPESVTDRLFAPRSR